MPYTGDNVFRVRLLPDTYLERCIDARPFRGVLGCVDQTQALVSFTKRSTAQISKRTGKPIMDEIKKKLS